MSRPAHAAALSAFGRVNEPVARVWHEHADGHIDAGPWTVLVLTPDDLARRGGDRVRRRAAMRGRPFDLLLVRGIAASDLKVGWPTHQLLRFRDERLGRYFAVDAHDALEAEWIAANAPVHGVVLTYETADQSVRYRVFDAAKNAGVALVGRAFHADAAALQLATPPLAATLLAPGVLEPAPLSAADAEAQWTAYAAAHAEPPKLRGGHPPEE